MSEALMEILDFIITNSNIILYSVFLIPFFIFLWKLFDSAGEVGWGSLIPIYNIIILLKIVRLKWFFVLLYFLPIIFILPVPVLNSVFVTVLIPVVYLCSIFFSLYVVYRAFVCIGKKPYDLMGFLFEVGIISPIVFLVLSNDLHYDPSELG